MKHIRSRNPWKRIYLVNVVMNTIIYMNVPENDAPIYDVEIDGKPDLREATFEKIGTDSVWFEDLLTYVGIEIWK